MKLVNLCQHEVAVHGNMKMPVFVLKQPEAPVRVVYDEVYFGKCMKRKDFVKFDPPLPPPKEGTTYVVSNDVRVLVPHRKDLASPCSDIRREGNVVGCKWLQIN